MKYRPEIDGLRAIAVVPVILFHAGFGLFAGGYVGVDVFFVVSGYLITTIIASDLEAGTFSLVRFYERRARRILPALVLVSVATAVVAFFVLYPADFLELSTSLLGVATFTSNFVFWRESGYFATASELKPLLHTWSLAVEEQYYIVFPPLLMALAARGRRTVAASLAVLAAISFGIAWGSISLHPQAAFFLLPSRGWELLVGALAALSHARIRPTPAPVGNVLSLAGLFLIGWAVLLFDDATPVPGYPALVPTVGAALVILFAGPRTLAGSLLAFRPLVAIGLISYSLYLWHQPVLALLRHATSLPLSGPATAAALLVTAVLSYASWRWVEVPFRQPRRVPRRLVLPLSAGLLAVVALMGTVGYVSNGASWRYDLPPAPRPWANIPCHGAERLKAFDDPLSTCLGARSNGRGGDLYLVGDSHAAGFTFPIAAAAKALGRDFHFINTEKAEHFPYSFWSGPVSDDPILDHVIAVSDPGDILLVAFHRGRLNETRDEHLKPDSTIPPNDRERLFERNFDAYAPRLSAAGVKILLIRDGPLLPETVTNLEVCMHRYRTGGVSRCAIDFEQDDATRTRQSRVFAELAQRHADFVSVIDPLPVLYGGKPSYDPIGLDGDYRMFDRHHLSEAGAMPLAAFFRAEIERIVSGDARSRPILGGPE